jgi:hypothetical protein
LEGIVVMKPQQTLDVGLERFVRRTFANAFRHQLAARSVQTFNRNNLSREE